MKDFREQQIRANLLRLVKAHAVAMAVLKEPFDILQAQLAEYFREDSSDPELSVKTANSDFPIVDRRVMCVLFRGKQCFLGNTLMLKLVERLTDSPNEYVSYRTLLTEVWHGQRDPSSIRSVVKELRIRLIAAEMFELAGAIKGHSGHYGLMLGSSH